MLEPHVNFPPNLTFLQAQLILIGVSSVFYQFVFVSSIFKKETKKELIYDLLVTLLKSSVCLIFDMLFVVL